MDLLNMRPVVCVAVLLTSSMIAGCSCDVSPLLPIEPYSYPKPTTMPPVVDESMESLLERFEKVLEEKAPKVAAALQPGLSEEEVSQLEEQYDVRLTDDLRLLYQWHNGTPWLLGPTITPLHEFYPLEEALQQRADLARDVESDGGMMKEMLAPTLTWMPIFLDGAGDGYHFDPERTADEGAVFDNFMENASYTFFPSIKNVIAGFIECYEQDCYFEDADGLVHGDFEAEYELWPKYGHVEEVGY